MGHGIVNSSINVVGMPTFIDVTPKLGSFNGGSLLTLIGNGFDRTSTVKLGLNSPCKILNVSTTSITCQTSKVEITPNENTQNVSIVIRFVGFSIIKFCFLGLESYLDA